MVCIISFINLLISFGGSHRLNICMKNRSEMALKYVIPNEYIDQLICCACGNHLSIFPIYLMSDKSGAICGRCTPLNKNEFVRDGAYEAIAEFLQFPCCYKKNGCNEVLTPRELEEHEVKCDLRKFECPYKSDTRCEWLGGRTELLGHFQSDHPNLLLETAEFKWSFDMSCKENFLLIFEGEFFVIKKELTSHKEQLLCWVQHIAAQSCSERYNYTLNFLRNDKSLTYKRSADDSEKVVVDVKFIKEKLNNPTHVLVQIEIMKAEEKKGEESSKTDFVHGDPKDLDWEVLNELKCPNCTNLMCPPIFQCVNGHSICNECKHNIKNCSSCTEDILDTRNFALEKLTRFLMYPCRFYKAGCNYVCKSAELKKHEEKCQFLLYGCPLKDVENCHMKITQSEMIPHCENYHKSSILKSNKITSPFNPDEEKECFYLKKFLENMFLVRFKYENWKFYWTVQLVGPTEECKKYKFDIDIADNSKNNLKCYFKGFCVPIKERIDFSEPHKYIMLTYEQLHPFIKTNLDYNIHIILE